MGSAPALAGPSRTDLCDAVCVLRMDGKVAFISGIGSVGPGWGNGRATATLLARQGASVFGTDIDAAAAEATRAIVEGEGGPCVVRQADMMASDSVAEAV